MQHHGDQLAGSCCRISLAFGNLVHEGKNALLNEIDQSLKHLRFAGEMAVERGFAYFKPGGQCRCGDAFSTRLLQHGCQCLQNLHTPFARLGTLARRGLPDS